MTPVSALLKAVKADARAKYPDLSTPDNEIRDVNRFAYAYLVQEFLRKQREELDKATVDATALSTFLTVNESVGQYDRRWRDEESQILYGTFRAQVWRFFNPEGYPLLTSWEEILSYGDLGAGSNIGARGTDFYTKMFSSDLTTTHPALYEMYRHCISKNPTWADAEATRTSLGYGVTVVDASRLSFVAKNDRTSRTICTEPTLNMFFQRGISAIVERRLKAFGVNLAIQPDQNRELARLGSLRGTFSTIDLKSASDSFALTMVRDVIPRDQLFYFELTRSPATVLPDGRRIELNMLSSMGNGYTFALQTAMFMCAILAAFEVSGQRRWHSRGSTDKNWAVFGDDIIVPAGDTTANVLKLLDLLGFVVNGEKTFVQGPFRESCGHDYLCGTNVRPVYAKTWSTRESLYALYNRIDLWCSQHGELPRTKRLIVQALGQDKLHFVPGSFPESSGIQIPYYLAVRMLQKDRAVIKKPTDPRTNTNSIRVRYREAVPVRLTVKTEDEAHYEGGTVSVPDGHRKRKYNSSGLVLALLKGGLRGRHRDNTMAHIPTRVSHGEDIRYATKSKVVPNWDWTGRRKFGRLPRAWVRPSG